MLVLSVCLGILVLLGVSEALVQRRDQEAIPVRIHVNGIRGKSTVVRMIYGALVAGGQRVMAKTTGTEPRVIYPDGTEQVIRRRGRPNIRETLWFLREARRAKATVVVVECMAVRPELQWVAEHRMLQATHGVITNVRLDHLEVMGRTLPEIAASLGNTIPAGGTLVTGDERFFPYFAARASALGAKALLAEAQSPEGAPLDAAEWLREDEALALAVAVQLGVDPEVAQCGMRLTTKDPGAVSLTTAMRQGREVKVVNALAANDPESLLRLRSTLISPDAPVLVVYNHRRDRPERLPLFVEALTCLPHRAILITGDPPPCAARARWKQLATVRFVPRHKLAAALDTVLAVCAAEAVGDGTPAVSPVVLACGNIKGAEPLLAWAGHAQPEGRASLA